ncbi:hypothetical protein [Cupriavidus alkaliphilus]|uniref:hypothetical protein n=1 Tax=Cupriavidus alkaliphilus TaxID=942866 RepID=UPI00339D51C8
MKIEAPRLAAMIAFTEQPSAASTMPSRRSGAFAAGRAHNPPFAFAFTFRFH